LTEDVCANGHPFSIQMPTPEDEAAIVAALADRTNDADKAWYPDGFARAIAAGFPVGQSPRELIEEGRRVARFRAAEDARRKNILRDMLAQHGIEIRSDGTFEGSL
jgi:hypothetical protein